MRSATTFVDPRAHRRVLGVVVALAIAATTLLLPVGGAAAAPSQQWHPCYQDVASGVAFTGARFECTSLQVPLDYDNDPGPKISIDLVRIPASDPDVKRGSLVMAAGGPGGSGIDLALGYGPYLGFGDMWGPIADQYDIVGFDQRGIGRSTPLRCFGNNSQAEAIFPSTPFPVVESDIGGFEQAYTLLDNQCTRRGNKVLEHMSTANVARDLDTIRQALGEELLNFYGLSYGGFVGQTYAALFPERVGAFILDSVPDPVAYANTAGVEPKYLALDADVSSQIAFEEFIRQCETAKPGTCPLAPNAGDRVAAVLESLRLEPASWVHPATGEERSLGYSDAISVILGSLYDPEGYSSAAEVLALIEGNADPVVLGEELRTGSSSEASPFRKNGFPNYSSLEAGTAVDCMDSNHPTGGLDTWFDAGQVAAAETGGFGELWAWSDGACALWSSIDEDGYHGSFEATTATPVLVIGGLYDPIFGYEGVLAAQQLLTDSALLVVDQPGHVSLESNPCATGRMGDYLADPAGYAASQNGLVCPSSVSNWFGADGVPVVIETDIEFTDDGGFGTFIVTEGSEALGCSSGSFEESDGLAGLLDVMTCESGPSTGTFTLVWQPGNEPGPGDVNGPWRFQAGEGDFAGLTGSGDFAGFFEDGQPFGAGTFTGEITSEQ